MRIRARSWPAVVAVGLTALPGAGQEAGVRLDGLTPAGGRTPVPAAWGPLQFGVTNLDPHPHELRVLVFYPEQPDVQYGRDVWVPGGSRVTSWLTRGAGAV